LSISSFWIHQLRLVGPWSPIHLLSIFTLVTLPLAVWKAHTHRVAAHRRIMIYLFSGALIVAGLLCWCRGGIITRSCSALDPAGFSCLSAGPFAVRGIGFHGSPRTFKNGL
jgi:uncharacterized membrane protein